MLPTWNVGATEFVHVQIHVITRHKFALYVNAIPRYPTAALVVDHSRRLDRDSSAMHSLGDLVDEPSRRRPATVFEPGENGKRCHHDS